jgi:C1A family cysteine protease
MKILGTHVYSGGDLPDSVDWTKKGAVTPIKNQGQCGSCWAFSSTGALEGAWQIATGKLVSLSEQQLVDCAKFRWGDMGCSGGLQPHAFKYMEQAAMCGEDTYPYTAKNHLFTRCKASNCSTDPALPKGALKGYKSVDSTEQALMEAVTQQPVAVSIEADQDVFHLYKHGIVQGKGCGQQLDHAVLAVGYGTDNGVKYWKVKNSWGTSWGEEGYVRIIRGTDECGILNGPPVYPVVDKNPAPSVDSIVV